MSDEKQRFRISAKQTAKGLWYFDATVEMPLDTIRVSDENDAASITELGIGQKLLDMIKQTEEAFVKDSKKLVTDD